MLKDILYFQEMINLDRVR